MTETNQQTQQDKAQIYELAFLLAPTVSEENLPAAFGKLKNALTEAGAVFISEEFPKSVSLAYPMDKIVDHQRRIFTAAYFGWIKFELGPEPVLSLKEELKRSGDLIRSMITRTVRESTLAPRRPHIMRRRPVPGRARPSEPSAPIDVEAVDKKIEELIKA